MGEACGPVQRVEAEISAEILLGVDVTTDEKVRARALKGARRGIVAADAHIRHAMIGDEALSVLRTTR